MTADIIEKLQEKATVLTKERKKRGKTVPEELLPQESIKQFITQSSHPGLHSASVPGILAIDVNMNDNTKILTGGADKNAIVFNKEQEQVGGDVITIARSVRHASVYYCSGGDRAEGPHQEGEPVVYHPQEDTVITGSHDATVRVWNVPTSQTMQVRVTYRPCRGVRT